MNYIQNIDRSIGVDIGNPGGIGWRAVLKGGIDEKYYVDNFDLPIVVKIAAYLVITGGYEATADEIKKTDKIVRKNIFIEASHCGRGRIAATLPIIIYRPIAFL